MKDSSAATIAVTGKLGGRVALVRPTGRFLMTPTRALHRGWLLAAAAVMALTCLNRGGAMRSGAWPVAAGGSRRKTR